MVDYETLFFTVVNSVASILTGFLDFIFYDFSLLAPLEFGVNITYGYFILACFIFSLLFKFLLAVPQTGGGGTRGSKSSKKGNSSSSSSSSDS